MYKVCLKKMGLVYYGQKRVKQIVLVSLGFMVYQLL